MMKKLISECLYFLSSHFGPIFKIFGPFILITTFLGPWLKASFSSSNDIWVYFLYLALFSFLQTYLMARFIKFMAFIASGKQIGRSVSWKTWFRLFVVYLIYGIAIMLGFIALIIPGIYIAARYAFADFETVLNNRSPISALNESWQDTKDIVGKLMIVTALMSGIQVLLGYGFGYTRST